MLYYTTKWYVVFMPERLDEFVILFGKRRVTERVEHIVEAD